MHGGARSADRLMDTDVEFDNCVTRSWDRYTTGSGSTFGRQRQPMPTIQHRTQPTQLDQCDCSAHTPQFFRNNCFWTNCHFDHLMALEFARDIQLQHELARGNRSGNPISGNTVCHLVRYEQVDMWLTTKVNLYSPCCGPVKY